MKLKRLFSGILSLALVLTAAPLMNTQADAAIGFVNIAKDCAYEASEPYEVRTYPNDYQLIDGKELTDGVKATTQYGTEWHAFYKQATSEIIIDLGETRDDIRKISIECEDLESSGITLPSLVRYQISEDGDTFTDLGYGSKVGDSTIVTFELTLDEAASGRYVRCEMTKGASVFVFCSEMEVFVLGEVEEGSGEEYIPTVDVLYSSGAYLEDSFLYGVAANTSYDDFLSIFGKTAGLTVLNAQGKVKTSGKIATGDTVKRMDGEISSDVYTVIIDGDLNGDGTVSALDYLTARRAILGAAELKDAYLKAALLANGKKLVAQDYLLIRRSILGLYDLHEKYEQKISEYEMDFQMVNASVYKMICQYEGKTLSLTFDKKTWGTWNIGTWVYDGATMAGTGTDWEYVYMAGKTAGSLDWSGGNHGSETLRSFTIYDGTDGKKLDLKVGENVQVKNLRIVEETTLHLEAANTDYCDVVRTYTIEGNKVSLTVDYDYTSDIYLGCSYTCMFPIAKTYGLYAKFFNQDGTTNEYESLKIGAADFSGPKYGKTAAAKVTLWGYVNPSYKFDVEIYTVKDSTDNFSNADKTFLWDMNTSYNKLYFSKYNSAKPTLVTTGTKFSTASSWTFYLG